MMAHDEKRAEKFVVARDVDAVKAMLQHAPEKPLTWHLRGVDLAGQKMQVAIEFEDGNLPIFQLVKEGADWKVALGEMRDDSLRIARQTRAEQDLENIKTQLQYYEVVNGSYPSTDQGLRSLIEMPAGEPKPRRWRQLMVDVPLDPWGKPYLYKFGGKRAKKDPYEIYSAGPDGKPDTADDIGNW